ncbi:MAG: succinate dehydrogenase cytochrome b subunit [Propionibacteriaceae bacterium]|nr:succinate dehydrogenase cytochrome b subunit [Propionibacteriaceae bacterium]
MHARALHSLVVKKVVMALTGLVLIAFLVMHMFGNLKMFLGGEAYNHYAEWLQGALESGGILEPLLPHGWFIWIFRAFLLVCLVLHIYCAAKVWAASLRGRGRKYVSVTRREQTVSARFMRWGGITLGLLLILHILMFTTKTVRTGFTASDEPYTMFVKAFGNWWVLAIYIVFMIVVCLHVRHGFWSAFTTLGGNVSPKARAILNALAYFVAALIFVGFLLPPVAVFLNLGVN